MKRILMIIAIVGILLVGTLVTASLVKDYTKVKEIKEIDPKKLCDKEKLYIDGEKWKCKDTLKGTSDIKKIKIKDDDFIKIDLLENDEGEQVYKVWSVKE